VNPDAPILFFDSGVGGLSVLEPTLKLLPTAPIVYAADSAGFPYGKRSEAEAAFGKIAADGTSGYRHLARLRETAELAQTDPKAAIVAYDKITADGAVGPVLQDLAALRAGALLIDANSYEEARRRLEPLTANDRTFRHTAREFLVLASSRAGDSAATKRWFDLMMTDVQTPAATRMRVEKLMALGASPGNT